MKHSRKLKHALAELFLRRAVASNQPVERRKWMEDARRTCQELIRSKADEPYPHYTLIKLGTLELEFALKEPAPYDKLNDEIARRTEQAICDGLQSKRGLNARSVTTEAVPATPRKGRRPGAVLSRPLAGPGRSGSGTSLHFFSASPNEHTNRPRPR
jgi:hypothetical protein